MALTRPRAAQIYDIDYKQATRVVTVSNITLSGGAPSQVDGVNLSLNDRVLVTGQSTLNQNGIYYVTTVGSGSNGTWSRSLDTNNTGEILTGTIVMVTEGLIYADTQWKLITDGVIDVGVTDQVWTQNYSANSISGGNSNVIVNSNANVTISSAGVANVLNITATGPIVTGNLLPSANITYNLGSTDLRWKDLWLSNSTLYIGNVIVAATATTLTVNGANVLTGTASGDILTGGNVSATGNVTGGNLLTGGYVSATGNITGDYFLGNVFYANGITASKIYSGNSEVNVTASGGNVNVSIGGTSNVAVFTTAGEYVTGLLSVTGNITSGNANIIGTTASTTKTTGALTVAGGLGVAGTAYTNRSVVQGAFGNIILNEFTGIFNQKDTGTALIQTTTNALSAGLGIQVTGAAGNGSQIYSTGTMDIKIGVVARAEDTPTGGTVIASVASTGLSVTGVLSATANVVGGNVLTAGLISATGNVTGNYFLGNVACASGIFSTKIFSGTTEANIVSANGNLAISVGGTSNVAVFATTGEYVTGLVSVTGNTTSGNILTGGQVSAAGNVTGSYLKGNASQVTGVNTFSQIFVTGTTTVNAASLTSNVTFSAGNNIVLTSDGSTVTIAYSSSGSSSIFATGGDMGLISQAVTASEDLGSVVDLASLSYDLGTLFSTVTYNQIDMTGFTSNINTGNLNAVGLVSAAGNITGNYILGNGSQLTGISSTLSGNLSGNLTGNGFGANAFSFVSATGNITGNNITAANTIGGVTSTALATLNITLQQNYGGF